eukprot:gnl/Dysnectes_brevis/2000_a2303_2588.p1 GENE.gnl/Dysnectes_brevis/2000_a2303_2588~~gnl/Dysnectes_brevis/2000_a2303_2588.p1  ORF type:complete len:351 (+),score=118.53 gnl/Dysnectes_brevis/2000_a2303_2588:51-1103(+)
MPHDHPSYKPKKLTEFPSQYLMFDDSLFGSSFHVSFPITEDQLPSIITHLYHQQIMIPEQLYTLIDNGTERFKTFPNVVDLPHKEGESMTVIGDLHGQFFSLLHIFHEQGWPSLTNRYLINGDIVDRGNFSLEILVAILCFTEAIPGSITLLRGNHETYFASAEYGFMREISKKVNGAAYEQVMDLFQQIPIAAKVHDTVFVVHGGIGHPGLTIEQIQAASRRLEPEEGIVFTLLWSDPAQDDGFAPSRRGVECKDFGPDVARDFLSREGLDVILRSHTAIEGGFSKIPGHGSHTVTLFSAPTSDSQGAFVVFSSPAPPNPADWDVRYFRLPDEPDPLYPIAGAGGCTVF